MIKYNLKSFYYMLRYVTWYWGVDFTRKEKFAIAIYRDYYGGEHLVVIFLCFYVEVIW